MSVREMREKFNATVRPASFLTAEIIESVAPTIIGGMVMILTVHTTSANISICVPEPKPRDIFS